MREATRNQAATGRKEPQEIMYQRKEHHFSGRQIEAQREEGTFPKSRSEFMAKLGTVL